MTAQEHWLLDGSNLSIARHSLVGVLVLMIKGCWEFFHTCHKETLGISLISKTAYGNAIAEC